MQIMLSLRSLQIALLCSSLLIAEVASTQTQEIATPSKTKFKNGETVLRDKSKPVRTALEEWYKRNTEAMRTKDVAAVMALRADDFHTMTPDGKVNGRADMEEYTRRFLGRIDHFISQDIQIGTIYLRGSLASADVLQDTVRMQPFPDGSLHKVESKALQRETWKQTPEGWKLFSVDNIHDLGVLVDGEPVPRR